MSRLQIIIHLKNITYETIIYIYFIDNPLFCFY